MKYAIIFLILLSCTLEPKYHTPQSSVKLQSSTNNGISQITWEEFFQSKPLYHIIQTALENNKDLEIASLNIELARSSFDMSKKVFIPTVNATTNITRQQTPAAFALFTPKTVYRGNLNVVSYELDFFGKLKNAKKSAYETLLATEEAKNIVKISIITETANAYVKLLADQEILKLITKSLDEQKNKLEIVENRKQNGRAFRIDVILAKTDFENIKVLQNTYKKVIEQDKHILMLLMGIFDESKIPQSSLNDITFNEDNLNFVPSNALLFRPDIKQAEYLLKSANADIGIARAAFFPSITLTGNYGYYGRELSTLFDSGSWSIVPQINLPIFDGGKNKINLQLTKTKKEILTAQYQKTIQNAFKEVLDELTNRKTIIEQHNIYKEIADLHEQSYTILQAQHLNGTVDSIIVINSHLNLITARQNIILQKQEYLQNLITLYKVFGGGSNFE